ncbi:MAG TPA: hypothetical protein VGZ00_05500 [Candidatus Baltobacteraceae bacterium]|nr:hypothetical protein [Candidatus Baltobacteraceae bacterium]
MKSSVDPISIFKVATATVGLLTSVPGCDESPAAIGKNLHEHQQLPPAVLSAHPCLSPEGKKISSGVEMSLPDTSIRSKENVLLAGVDFMLSHPDRIFLYPLLGSRNPREVFSEICAIRKRDPKTHIFFNDNSVTDLYSSDGQVLQAAAPILHATIIKSTPSKRTHSPLKPG